MPRVLVIKKQDDIKLLEQEQYDYVIVSHQKLNNRYIDALTNYGFDFCIVDEPQEMKNLMGGVRAQSLLKVSDAIQENDG